MFERSIPLGKMYKNYLKRGPKQSCILGALRKPDGGDTEMVPQIMSLLLNALIPYELSG